MYFNFFQHLLEFAPPLTAIPCFATRMASFSAERLVYMAISYLSVRHCHVTVKIATELIVSLHVIRGEAVYRQRRCINQGGSII